MSYLLDTNAWIRYLNPADSPVKYRVSAARPRDIVLCSVVNAELYFGAYRSSRREANLSLLNTLFLQFVSIPFDDRSARVFGEIRAALLGQGTPIGPYDLQIAAIALAHQMTLGDRS
ncbi:MAG: type II toxin-antitoxin system VapC family toxin [Gammaproteobacteria bacterium]